MFEWSSHPRIAGSLINTINVTPPGAANIEDLKNLYDKFLRPYGRRDILRFNSAYRILYPELNRLEKARAEVLVDGLLENLESENLASKIYGVV